MTEHPAPASEPSSSQAGLALGAILVIVGIILFAGQMVDIGFADLGWPFWVIAVGIAILLIGLLVVTEAPVVVAGTVVTTVGLVLLYQNTTDHWESWAYAWALVGPAASGLGMALWGIRTGNGSAVRGGLWGLLGGLAFFAVGFLFFEAVIGLSGFDLGLPEWTLPAAIIGIGLVILLRGLLQRPDTKADEVSSAG
jgi:hypothetical protein